MDKTITKNESSTSRSAIVVDNVIVGMQYVIQIKMAYGQFVSQSQDTQKPQLINQTPTIQNYSVNIPEPKNVSTALDNQPSDQIFDDAFFFLLSGSSSIINFTKKKNIHIFFL